jgi:hypothetical protein
MRELFVTGGERYTKHVEGDVWSEKGKVWTIKNGIKRTVTKMDAARKEFLMPIACPKCGNAMKAQADAAIWSVNNTCLNCLVQVDHEKII